MYLVYPNSSFKLDDYTLGGMSFSTDYMSASQPMNLACQNLTISKVTNNDMGTMFVNKRIQMPKLKIQVFADRFIVQTGSWR